MVRQLFFLIAILTLSVAPAARAQSFQLRIVDSQTGRGVPLVELLSGGQSLFTDSNGIIAIDDPAMLNQNLDMGFQSYGYSNWGGTVQTTAGGSRSIAIDRQNRAERLYRVTGVGIYEDSVQLGAAVPISHPLINANVKGQDSVQTAIYKNQIYWFWGDTLYEVGFGNFRTAGARSALPGQGGLDPSLGVNLNYFVDAAGSARQMMPLTDPGPVWTDGVFTVRDNFGTERLLSHFSRINPDPNHLFEVLEHGLALFNDSTETFQRFRNYALDAPIAPRGHAFRHTVEGQEYIYFAEDYPNVRVKADWASVSDITKWEAYTPLETNSRFDSANPPLEVDAQGDLVFGWKKNTNPYSSSMLNDLVQHGHLDRDESPFRLQDHATGAPVNLHRASVHWNEYRRNWIMIGTEFFGDSLLGEVWFSEAPSPEGPWENAVQVLTHDRGTSGDYTFYNPTSHPFFDQEGGRYIYFEGTYANTFSGNSTQTPLYDYNQMMYRLDLSTIPSLAPLRGDYNDDGSVDGADLLVWQRTVGANVEPFAGADGDGDGVIDAGDLEPWKLRFGVNTAYAGGANAQTAVPEPSTIDIFLLAGTALVITARRHGTRHHSTTASTAATVMDMRARKLPMLQLDRLSIWLYTAAITAISCLNAPTRLDANEAKVTANAWPEADALFRRDPRWLGADGASTVELGDGRILWLFSDTFIGNKVGATRFDATMVRNSVAIQAHADPTTAEFKAFWKAEGDRPASFFADDGQEWFWPGDGELVDGKLIVFMMRVERKEGGLGFRVLDWTARLVDNPLEPPSKWSPRPVETPTESFGAKIGFGTVMRDGDYLYAYAPAAPTHAIYVVRWPITLVLAGDLTQPEWWSPADAAWRPHQSLTALPEPVIDHGQAEFTVHLDEPKRRYLQVQTAFFPIGPLALRTASKLTGPWSRATNFYDPAELSGAPKGFDMYSAKAHPEIAASGDLAITYCTNLRSIYDVVRAPEMYYPRFVRMAVE